MQLLVQTNLTQDCKIKHRNVARNVKAISLCHGARVTARIGPGPPPYLGFTITLSHSDTAQSLGVFGTNDQPRQRYLPDPHKTHKRQTFIPPTGSKTGVPASGLPQTGALDRAGTVKGSKKDRRWKYSPTGIQLLWVWCGMGLLSKLKMWQRKKYLAGINFDDDDDEVQEEVMTWFKGQVAEFYDSGI